MNPLIRVTDLRVHYGNVAVSHIPSLEVYPGECVAIVGESGSGKTSALMGILGLSSLSGGRATGSVIVGETEVIGASEHALSTVHGAAIALVSQSPQSALNPTMRIGALARRALKRHGVKGAEAETRLREAMANVVLPIGLLRRFPHEISGGQAQRFSLGLAVALRARCIIADEPTSALDVTVQAEIVRLLQRLRTEMHIGVLFVSHDLALVSTTADRIIVMKDGEVVDEGHRADILTAPKSSYTRELLNAIPAWRHHE